MYLWMDSFVYFSSWMLQFVIIALALFIILRFAVPKRKNRWTHLSLLIWKKHEAPKKLLKLLRISRDQQSFSERELLLKGCGFSADAAWYFVGKRIAVVMAALTIAAMLVMLKLHIAMPASMPPSIILAVAAAALLLFMFDQSWLRSIRKVRTLQITKEIYIVSNQLLYLSDSQLHIHVKLTRTVSFTKIIRADLEQMLADWYHHPRLALQRLKERLGTEEGMSFIETIDALRQHESSHYYELLKQRISDYKDKLELAKESKKESTSYVLFVLAGIPILYTFQVFIYPWVREGQKLFMSLQ